MVKIAVFASGSGSNFQSIVESAEQKKIDASVDLLVCDKKDAYVLTRADKHCIPVFSFSAKDYSSKEMFEKEIVAELQRRDIELIVLAGYMRLVGPTLLREYEGRIINIHPSLLPAFPGLDAIGQAFRIEETDTKEDVQKKIQSVEHQLYPTTIQHVISQLQRSVN
jgi:phosphoribosylglycinamide formyltransferase 1